MRKDKLAVYELYYLMGRLNARLQMEAERGSKGYFAGVGAVFLFGPLALRLILGGASA